MFRLASLMTEAGMTVAITRTEHIAGDLRRMAARLLALAMILDGHSRADAAQL